MTFLNLNRFFLKSLTFFSIKNASFLIYVFLKISKIKILHIVLNINKLLRIFLFIKYQIKYLKDLKKKLIP